jgi:hypothetical protein
VVEVTVAAAVVPAAASAEAELVVAAVQAVAARAVQQVVHGNHKIV